MGKKTQQREEHCMQPETKIAIFKGRKVRKILNQNEWYFSVVDVVEILSGSSIPRRYWSDLKKKLTDEGYSELYGKIVQLKLPSSDGKLYMTDCADTETMFRVVQSISSPIVSGHNYLKEKEGQKRIG